MRLQPDQFWSFNEWFMQRGGLLSGFIIALTLIVIGFVLSFLVAMLRHGPGEGFLMVSRYIRDLFRSDLPNTSVRRVTAIARLAFKEAVRRRVLVVVAIFIVALMFGGWYLDPDSDHPSQLYIPFVLTSTNYLVLLLGLYLSTFSLPTDIKNKTIHTIVTKPVRASEIVLGRVFGFMAIGTLILVTMGVLSYFFVVRGLSHTHEALTVPTATEPGETSLDNNHRHTFTIGPDGEGVTDIRKDHYHRVRVIEEDGQQVYQIGRSQGDLLARVPVYGTLQFTDRDGTRGNKEYGLNVGYISEYKKYVAGDTLMSGVWTFDGIDADRFEGVLPIEMNLSVFRTYKGDIVTPIRGILILRSTDGRYESERQRFLVKEFQTDQMLLDRSIQGFVDGEARQLDIFDDLAANGQLEVIIRCDDHGQYIGMAQADLYLRAGDKLFGYNFFKGYVSLWLQLLIVVSFGVMFSTFLSGPVAMIATLSVLMLGFFGNTTEDYFQKREISGGGPLESTIRLVSQRGSMIDMDLGNDRLEQVIKTVDLGLMYGVELFKTAVPNFGVLNTSDFIAYGIDLFEGLLLRHLVIALGYFVATMVTAYFFMKTREVAA